MSYADLPREFNAAVHFVDRHVREGRGGRTALVLPEGRLTYDDLHANVDRRAQGSRAPAPRHGRGV